MNLKTMSDMCKFTASVLNFFDDACSVPHFQQHFVIILFKHIFNENKLEFCTDKINCMNLIASCI